MISGAGSEAEHTDTGDEEAGEESDDLVSSDSETDGGNSYNGTRLGT